MSTPLTLPALAALWPGQGGHFAGLLPSLDGSAAPDVLIVSPADVGDFEGQWLPRAKSVAGASSYHDGRANTAAMAKAGSAIAKHALALQIDGHADWYIPGQAEAHLLAATCKQLFQPRWYWTSTQLDADFAWGQLFFNGRQGDDDLDLSFQARVRAVRRFSLQSFGPLVFGGAA